MSRKYLNKLSETIDCNKKVSSELAEKMMRKMGWSEGSGLGKHKQGDTEPIALQRRKTNLGLGAKAPQRKWNDNWWETLFNDTVKNFKAAIPKKRVKLAN